MNKFDAVRLIKETFQNSFDKKNYIILIKNLFKRIVDSKLEYQGLLIKDAFKPYIRKYERIGKYQDSDNKEIDILIIYLHKETSLERARTMQRNFVAWYLNGGRGGELRDAAVVAFISPDEEDWRFSLVKMEYKLEETDRGKIKPKQELSPAKRWSFLVGKNETSHTAQSRLIKLLEDDERFPALKDLEEAFNIEKVTKEFFQNYKELFLRVNGELEKIMKYNNSLKHDFEEKGIDVINFSKKLLGQIVFLYFLQKKGWFGVERDKNWGTGPRNFLRQLFEKKHSGYRNFFNDILEPLFYEALAKERDKDYFSRFNCKIPFLNGGLFEPINDYDWVDIDIDLPNELFSNNNITKEGDTGKGILDVFDRYNFTVKEDEPLEKEVAIDPEMLGKVFENLLDVKDRKSKGSYYTPREIVHYMCQESLINYLATELENNVPKEDLELFIHKGEQLFETERIAVEKKEQNENYKGYYKLKLEKIEKYSSELDEKLAKIKVCDPAIGSGAFPVGMMTEIVKARNLLTIYLGKNPERTIYNFKRHAIQNSLYGVDIDPGAVEIAKLRLWLSLVVDEEDIKQIKPLPNLDYKIMQGNSLLEEYEGIKLFDEKIITFTSDNGSQVQKIKERQSELQKEYFQLHSADKLTGIKKLDLENELKKQRDLLNQLTKSKGRENQEFGIFDILSEAKKKADELKKLHTEFFDTTSKSKKDILKKRIETLVWDLIETTLKEQGKLSKLKDLEKFKKFNIRPFFLWKLHYEEVFQEKGGFDVVIGNPPYVRQERIEQKYKIELSRDHLDVANSLADLYVYFFSCGLKIAKNEGTIIFITLNKWLKTKYGIGLRKKLKEKTVDLIIDFFELPVFEAATEAAITKIINTENMKPTKYFPIKSLTNLDLENLIYSNNQIVIKDETEWKFIDKNHNDLLTKFYSDSTDLKNFVNNRVYRGLTTGFNEAFVLKDNIAKELLRTESKVIVRKYAKSTDISKWQINNENAYFLATGYNLDIKNKYPSAYNYLKKFKAELKNRLDQGKNWYNLRACSYYDEFERLKIIYMHTAKNHEFYLDREGRYINNSCYMIITESLFLFFFLNSKLFNWFKRIKFVAFGDASEAGRVKLDYNKMITVPIKKISLEIENEFEKMYKIPSTVNNKRDEFEQKVDLMMYKLYKLTYNEVKIIDPEFDMGRKDYESFEREDKDTLKNKEKKT